MAKAVTNEKNTHFTMKEIAEMTLDFFMVQGYPNLRIETEKNVGRFIPDVLYYSDDKLIACLEVVNFNPMSKVKRRDFKNKNRNLYSVKVTKWTLRYEGIPFSFWKQGFIDFFTDVLKGLNNAFMIETESQQDLPTNAIVGAEQVHFVRYEIRSENDIRNALKQFDLTAFDGDGNPYHLLFMSAKARKKMYDEGKDFSSFRRGNEPIYYLANEKECWIDALLEGPTFVIK